MFRGDDPSGERPHLGAGLDPSLGEDAQTFSRDGALGDDDLTGQHQAGQLLHFCTAQEHKSETTREHVAKKKKAGTKKTSTQNLKANARISVDGAVVKCQET